jgi:hypothetical protein
VSRDNNLQLVLAAHSWWIAFNCRTDEGWGMKRNVEDWGRFFKHWNKQFYHKLLPVPVGVRSKQRMVLDRLKSGVVDSNTARVMFCVSVSLYFFMSYVGRGVALGRSPIQGILPKFLKEFIVSEVIVNWIRPEGVIRETNNNSCK